MGSQAFELLVITPEKDFPQEIHWVNALFAEGLGTLHLRKPGWRKQEMILYLNKVEDQYHSRIMVHYQEEVLKEIAVKGIHYKFSDLPQQKSSYAVSCGCHSWQEFREIEKRMDYAFLSPFYNSISKKGYEAKKELWDIPAEVNTRKALALGGIQKENIHQLRELNLKGAAVLGAVWNSPDPVKAYTEIEAEIRGFR